MKTMQRIALWVGVLYLLAGSVQAADWHVATNGNDGADGTTWPTAKLTIQAGVDAATGGDTVWVSNGVYATGGRVALGALLTNRVVIDKPITVQSLNGPDVTKIQGLGPQGVTAVRCAYVGTNAVLSGFTLEQGATLHYAPTDFDDEGGGVWSEASGTLNNCRLVGNVADHGGGVIGGTLNHCIFTENSSATGGGAYKSTLNNCLLTGNTGNYGAGAHSCTLNNCTVSDNLAGYSGGGTYGGVFNNCIVYFNLAPTYPNYSPAPFNFSCTTPDPGGTNNITDDPQFVDAAAGDYRLRAGYPCIDGGNNSYVFGTTDLDGNSRIINGTVDMGAYERQTGGGAILSLQPTLTNYSVEAVSGGTLSVRANVSWVATTNIPWLSITSGFSGATNGTVIFDVSLNDSGFARTGTIVVAGGGFSRTCMVMQAANWYVATNGNDSATGNSWDTAKLTIQAAVDAATKYSTVWVSNGVYATGGRVGVGTWSNRVTIDRAMIVQSVNGPEATIIVGGGMRCAYVTNGAVLKGFTLTNGVTALDGGSGTDYIGGGVYCESPGLYSQSTGVVENCILTGNLAYDSGGGAIGGTLNNCQLIGNSVSPYSNSGGGAAGSLLNNCLVSGNSAYSGGGVYHGTLNNCTVVNNSALFWGGVSMATLNNCIVYSNSAVHNGPNYGSATFNYSCTTPDPGGTGNITNNPQFADEAASDYHLKSTSLCIDAGNNDDVVGLTDLDGNPRILNGTVDMGAYEGPTELEIYPSITNLISDASSGINIAVTSSISWTAATNVQWLSITSGESGITNGIVVFAAEANVVEMPRTGAVVVAGGGLSRTCTVVQAAFVSMLEINPIQTNISFNAVSGLVIEVMANRPWTASTNVPWLSITSGDSGTTNGSVNISVEANGAVGLRTGSVTIEAGSVTRTYTVLQEGVPPELEIDPMVTNLSSEASTGNMIVLLANLPWTTSMSPWLSITSGDSGVTNGLVVFSAGWNAWSTVRTGSVVVSGSGISRTCTVVQAARVGTATNWYVATNGNDSADGLSWGTAKLSIQAGINAAVDGDTVWVGPGDYQQGLTIAKGIRLISTNGMHATVIRGNGSRCITITHFNAVVSGFTITGGRNENGAGVNMSQPSALVEKCIIVENSIEAYSTYESDTSYQNGGGIYGGMARNCLIVSNSLSVDLRGRYSTGQALGAGAMYSQLENCTMADNTASVNAYYPGWAVSGGFRSTFINSIEWQNDGNDNSYDHSRTSNPIFTSGNAYHLSSNSPCIDAGTNQPWMVGATDLDGEPRIMHGIVDIGCFEYAMPLDPPALFAPISVPPGSTVQWESTNDSVWVQGTKPAQSLVIWSASPTNVLTTNGLFQTTEGTTWSNWVPRDWSPPDAIQTWSFQCTSPDQSLADSGLTILRVTLVRLLPPSLTAPVAVQSGSYGLLRSTNDFIWMVGTKPSQSWAAWSNPVTQTYSTNGFIQTAAGTTWSNLFQRNWQLPSEIVTQRFYSLSIDGYMLNSSAILLRSTAAGFGGQPEIWIVSSISTTRQPHCSLSGTRNLHTVENMWMSNQANGAVSFFDAPILPSTNWTSASLPLSTGTNVLTVFGTNMLGDLAMAQYEVFLECFVGSTEMESNGAVRVDWVLSTDPSITNQWQRSTNLLSGAWTNLGGPFIATQEVESLIESNFDGTPAFFRMLHSAE